MTVSLDDTDRKIINTLQGGFPISERPFLDAAKNLGIAEQDLIDRITRLVANGVLSRFGPMHDAEKLGGAVTLCAIAVPEERFEEIAEIVNRREEVAHNYARNHVLNMWFVIAVEELGEIERVISEIEAETGLTVFNFPKQREFYIGLKVDA